MSVSAPPKTTHVDAKHHMTIDSYSHVTLDMQQPAADAMDRLFG
jgi:hypothetical protein